MNPLNSAHSGLLNTIKLTDNKSGQCTNIFSVRKATNRYRDWFGRQPVKVWRGGVLAAIGQKLVPNSNLKARKNFGCAI
jgi:hypothetical protein